MTDIDQLRAEADRGSPDSQYRLATALLHHEPQPNHGLLC